MKKIKIISIFLLFLISFLVHFVYDKFPSIFTLIFFPINESIWEHMKIIITSTIIYSIFESIYFYKKNIQVNNYMFSVFFTSIVGIIFYLIVYIPLYKLFGHNMIISLILLFVTYVLISYLSYILFYYKNIIFLNYLSIIFIIITYIIFAYLSYKPIKNFLFYDMKEEKYGLNEYKI